MCVCILYKSETYLNQPPARGPLYLIFIGRWLLYRGRLLCFSAIWAGAREAGCFRELYNYVLPSSVCDHASYTAAGSTVLQCMFTGGHLEGQSLRILAYNACYVCT